MKRVKGKDSPILEIEKELQDIRALLKKKCDVLWDSQRILTLLEVSKAINSTLDLEELLIKIMRGIIKISGGERGFLMLIGKEGELELKVQEGISGREFINSKISRSVTDWVIKTGKPVFIKDIREDNRFSTKESIIALRLKTIMCIPLKVRKRVIGLIYIDSKSISPWLTESDLVFFEALAEQAAIAIENARLFQKAVTDELTLLYNRSYFENRLEEEISKAKRYGTSLSIIYMDVDGLKRVNDRYGHLFGDRVLTKLANLMKSLLRRYDSLCRFGGDEFIMILPDTERETAKKIAGRICDKIQRHTFEMGKEKIKLTVSMGIAVFPEDADNKIDLLDRADEEMYRVKRRSKCRES